MPSLALALVAYVVVTAAQIIGASRQSASVGDTALVLGAAAYGDIPSPVFAGRLAHAAALLEKGAVGRIVVTGGLGARAHLAEGDVGARWLQRSGVPSRAILVERASRTTRQTIRLSVPVLPPNRAGRVLIVSDPLHVARATAMARHDGYDAVPAPTPFTRYRGTGVKVRFLVRELWLVTVWRLAGI